MALKLALRVAYKGNKPALTVLKLLGGKSPSLFAFQEHLPNLPLPQLKDTLDKWLLSVEPIVSAVDFKKAQVLSDPPRMSCLGAGTSCTRQRVRRRCLVLDSA